jgi:LCP family protein required for cell wall assembly
MNNGAWDGTQPPRRPQHDSVTEESLHDYDEFFRTPNSSGADQHDATNRAGSAPFAAPTAAAPATGAPTTAVPVNRSLADRRATPPAGGQSGGGSVAGANAPKKRHRVRRILLISVVVLLAYVVALATVFALSTNKIDAMPQSQAADTAGSNYLLVGTDNRENLSKKQRKQLHTGFSEGARTDSIMLLHVPTFGDPTLVSLPRDSWVPIAGHGSDKINAAYSFGGPPLLIDTVETVTGLRVDHYVEIGMDGVAGVVDSLGGVTLCPKQRYNDARSGLKVKAGCQEMDGKTALAYVRMRYSDPRGDIGRAERQREYIAAVGKKAMSPTTWLNPIKMFSVDTAAAGALTVDQSTGIVDDARLALALGRISMGSGESTSVPIENESLWVGGQQAVKWDTDKALQLFESMS